MNKDYKINLDIGRSRDDSFQVAFSLSTTPQGDTRVHEVIRVLYSLINMKSLKDKHLETFLSVNNTEMPIGLLLNHDMTFTALIEYMKKEGDLQ